MKRVARRAVVVSMLGLAALPAAAETPAVQMSTQRLADFRREAEVFNQQDPFANAYRAGHYNGYLAGVLDALQAGHRVCFRECVCELDKRVGEHLAAHPDAAEKPAAEWLVPLLEARYPCK